MIIKNERRTVQVRITRRISFAILATLSQRGRTNPESQLKIDLQRPPRRFVINNARAHERKGSSRWRQRANFAIIGERVARTPLISRWNRGEWIDQDLDESPGAQFVIDKNLVGNQWSWRASMKSVIVFII